MHTKAISFLIAFSIFGYIVAQSKPGSCPNNISNLSICGFTCRRDSDCQGPTKCCRTRCGAVCRMPAEQRETQRLADKPGQCPEKPIGPWVCSSRCSGDADCVGTKKCCKNRCGAMACVKPEQ